LSDVVVATKAKVKVLCVIQRKVFISCVFKRGVFFFLHFYYLIVICYLLVI